MSLTSTTPTSSTSSSAISRHVVHFPPAANTTFVEGSRLITWSRDAGAPGAACGSRAKGRQPRHALSTSFRDTRTCAQLTSELA